ncbi:interleukin-27 subunit beta [Hypomesus transpacificus]|uniref:interleukin-27 subunit beta n=1 Tax=Hypomesus transpacificus TaxID=137520 RepID=UPI001F085217|nr:interleukin-27 subunit beta [Hypomesus transpacificus]
MSCSGVQAGWLAMLLLLLSGALCVAHPIREVEDVYVAVGSSLSTGCGGAAGVEEGVAVGVEWRLNGSVFQRGANLTLLSTSLEDQGLYSCYDSAGLLLRSLLLDPGYPPSSPKVQCWSPRYPLQAICSWEGHAHNILRTHFILSYRGKGETQQCRIHHSSGRPLLNTERAPLKPVALSLGAEAPPSGQVALPPGQEWFCVLENMDQYTLYQINITAVNPLGRSTQLLSRTMEDIIKPDPPVNVRVVPKSSRTCFVEWAPPPSWPFFSIFPLKYKVKYQYERQRRGTTETAPLGPYETSSVLLGGLVPGSTYLVQVCAIDLLDLGFCSDWSTPVHMTMPTRKKR